MDTTTPVADIEIDFDKNPWGNIKSFFRNIRRGYFKRGCGYIFFYEVNPTYIFVHVCFAQIYIKRIKDVSRHAKKNEGL